MLGDIGLSIFLYCYSALSLAGMIHLTPPRSLGTACTQQVLPCSEAEQCLLQGAGKMKLTAGCEHQEGTLQGAASNQSVLTHTRTLRSQKQERSQYQLVDSELPSLCQDSFLHR